jgi:hypothetical protein
VRNSFVIKYWYSSWYLASASRSECHVPIGDHQSVFIVPCGVVASTRTVLREDDECWNISRDVVDDGLRLTSSETIGVLALVMTMNPG